MFYDGAGWLAGARHCERASERTACCDGRCEHGFAMTSGQVTPKMFRLKGMRFAAAVIERRKRRETGAEGP